ncbi:hypothetical protein ACLOJK_006586 [Asimina triloba]
MADFQIRNSSPMVYHDHPPDSLLSLPERISLSTPPPISVLLTGEDDVFPVSMVTTARAVWKWSVMTINGENGFRLSSLCCWSDQIVRLELIGCGLHG